MMAKKKARNIPENPKSLLWFCDERYYECDIVCRKIVHLLYCSFRSEYTHDLA
jgi:hypothetical protein